MTDQPITCRGVRGATCAEANTREAILNATAGLLEQLIAANDIQPADVASVIFTLSPDLNAAYPAAAARQLGWTDVPLMGMQEIDHPDGLKRAIRILIHWNTRQSQSQIRHIYTNGAEVLRPEYAIHNAKGD